MDDSKPQELDVRELLGWAEFMCWTALVLAPLLWWVQGPSVSQDQFVVRTALVVLAGTGAVGLRTAALVRRFRSGRGVKSEADPPHQADLRGD